MTDPTNNRILIIDDNRAIHEDFRKILLPSDHAIDQAEADFFGESAEETNDRGFEVDSAYQGEEGLAAIQRAMVEGRPYAMAFVDVRMPPGMDGIETTARIWKLCAEMQVVICTAHSDYSWREMVTRLGGSDRLLVLKKPFTAIEALQLACALTEKATLARQARMKLEEIERIVEERTASLTAANEALLCEMKNRREAEERLLRAQRLESIGTLASGIAHDLNNTLTPIVMSAPLLRGDLCSSSRDFIISTIEASADRAANIVKQVLTFARGAEGERQRLQPKHLVREMKRIASDTFPRGIRVRTKSADDIWLVNGDPTQLHQVLMNLCVNARDAMPDGGVLLIDIENFEVDAQYASTSPGARPGRHVLIRVSDTGSGIPRPVLQKIFDPFFTTKPVGKGTGLGLSTVAGIVKSHDGFIEVQSEVGKGTTFAVYLPAQEDSEPGIKKVEATISPRGNGELILIVDDEAAVRDIMKRTLTSNGYRALTAADGTEAVTMYVRDRENIRAVLTDVVMPIVDGVALCRTLRKINPAVQIIASSGEAGHSRLAELRALNVSYCLPKPFKTHELLSALETTLK